MNSKHQQKYQIVWARVAENDLKQIIEYIVSESPRNALKILLKIKQRLQASRPFLKEAGLSRNFRIRGYLNTEG